MEDEPLFAAAFLASTAFLLHLREGYCQVNANPVNGLRDTHDSGRVSPAVCFKMVSFPPDAAVTICFSIELLIFADKFCANRWTLENDAILQSGVAYLLHDLMVYLYPRLGRDDTFALLHVSIV